MAAIAPCRNLINKKTLVYTPILRPTPAQIVANGSFLVNANASGVPFSNFSDGSYTFTPEEFEEYVSLVCSDQDPLPICLMLVKRVDNTVQSIPQKIIDGKYTPLP